MAATDPLAMSLGGATGAWVWDLVAKRIQGDARFASLCGLDPAAAAQGVDAETFFARVHPDDRKRLRIAVAAVEHGAEFFQREFRIPALGGVRWIRARGRSEHDDQGANPRFSGALMDVTEQKRGEERLEVVQSAGGVGTFEYVEGFGTVSVSRQFCRLLGLQPTDALPVRTLNRLVHPDDPPLISIGASEDEVGPSEREIRVFRADTRESRWIAVRGERRREGEHGGTRFIGVIYDVTEARATQQALRELNATLEERVEAALVERKLWADIVESSDALAAALGPDHRFLVINKAFGDVFARLFSRRPKVGDSLPELLGDRPEALAALQAEFAQALAGESSTSVIHLGPEGEAGIDLETRKQPLLDRRGLHIGAFLYAVDVTERLANERRLLEAEEALRQAHKMEAVGQLTGGLAHDFNNMLTGVIGGLDMIRRRIGEGRLDHVDRFIEAALTSADRAAALTHRLLAFSRRQTLDPRPIDVNALVSSMEDLLRRTLGENVDLAIELETGLWPALSDANQLENALLNLAINARDAMPEGGTLTIETANNHLTNSPGDKIKALQPGDYVVISVRDTGQGMEPDVLSRVFDPFFTTKPIGQGTGLGLSMVYGFARQSGGHVSVESKVGGGTTAKLFLPRETRAPDELLATAEHSAPGGAGQTVLIVEDDEQVRMLVVEVLKELGYKALECAEGGAAAAILTKAMSVDLLITDVGLPGMSGRQLSEIARASRPDLPILFITGYAAGASRRADLLDAGMDMIAKPFAVDALAHKIHLMIERGATGLA